MEADPAHWLALNRLPTPAREVRDALVEGEVSVHEVIAASRVPPDWRAVKADLAWLETPDRHLLTLTAPAYPTLLRQIPDPPPVLFVLGDRDLLGAAQVAVVGSRRATPCGVETAHALAAALAEHGLAITSGLALGVDAAGHRGALAAGGRTLAVAAGGLDRVYPRRHRCLARAIAGNGALVSEFSPGTAPLAGHFPRRNRIISGLALGVVVVEAARRSGSLITARLAGEQGREVFAVPGPIQSPVARGCHRLIRQGAKLVEEVSDILEELPDGPWNSARKPSRPVAGGQPVSLDRGEKKVLESLAYRAASVDSIVERSGLTAETVCSILLALELRGLVAPVPGGAYCRVAGEAEYR